jgi:hypothetical protein
VKSNRADQDAKAALVVYSGGNGSFVLAGSLPDASGVMRWEFDSRGSYSVLAVDANGWREATVHVGRSRDRRSRLLEIRTARRTPEGGVEARALRQSSAGRRITRDLIIDHNGNRRWSYENRRADGIRVLGEGVRDVTTRLTRRRLAADGTEEWRTQSETTVDAAATIPALGVRRTIATTATEFPDGRGGQTRKVFWTDGSQVIERVETAWTGVVDGAESQSLDAVQDLSDGSYSAVATVALADGGRTVTSTDSSGPMVPDDGPSGSLQPEGTRIEDKTTTIERDDAGNDIGATDTTSWSQRDTDSGGDSVSGGWESTTLFDDGGSGSSQGAYHVGSGGSIEVSTQTDPDGTTTTTESMTDATGNGSEHVKKTDKDGNVIEEDTHPISGGAPSKEPPAKSDEQKDDTQDKGNQGGENKQDEGDHHGAPDSGMDWDGPSGTNDEGPPRVLPHHSADIMDILNDPRVSDDPEGGGLGDRIGTALGDRAMVPPTQGGDTGWGEATGSESAPSLTVTGAGGIVGTGRVRPPTEDWGEWNDPRAHVASIGTLLETLVQGRLLAPAVAVRAMSVNRELSAHITSTMSASP